jgi:hypothetical protein
MAALTQTIAPALGELSEPSDGSLSGAQASVLQAAGGGGAFRFALLFLSIYYIRPQDWVPGLAGFNIVRPIMLLWVLALVMERSRSPLQGWLRTPHDWAMLFLYSYVVWNAPSEAGAKMGMLSLVVFYYLTTHALSTWERVLGYLKVWNVLLLILAAFGVLLTLGLDITKGQEMTDYYQGRISLGTWMANNPNALGHTVVVAIPLSYLLYFWRGSATGRLIIFPLCVALVGWCALETESKGAFLVGGILTMLLFVVGRPRWVQIFVVIASLSAGMGALKFLPRMEKMGDLRSDDGVQGRLMAWEMAQTAMEQNTTGVGWRQFIALVDWQEGNYWHYADPKSTHSSIVQIGADLGKYGLFIWLLVLWTGLRTLIFLKARNDTEERCRRAVMSMLTAYLISGWMINREYHTEYYLLVALAAAIHRLNIARSFESDPDESENAPVIMPWSVPALNYMFQPEDENEGKQPNSKARPLWNKLNWIDISVGVLATWAFIEIWDYILKNL